MEVYRYIKYEHFKDMVETKTLHFVNPFTEWPDEKEGYLFRFAEMAELDERIPSSKFKDAIIEQITSGGIHDEKREPARLDWFGMQCQSWSMAKDSTCMWKKYAYGNKAVCIAIDLCKLKSLEYLGQKVEGMPVEYKDTLSVESELKQVLGRHNELFFPLVLKTKHEEFEYEHEYRLYVVLLDKSGKRIEKANFVKIPIFYEMSEFINYVFPHPKAGNEFINQLKGYCKRYGIECKCERMNGFDGNGL